MVFRRSKSRRSNTKRRYTKRRGGSHKRKVYRNKHGRKSYRVKRGGETGNLDTCNDRCRQMYSYDANTYAYCKQACQDAAVANNKTGAGYDALFDDEKFTFPPKFFPPKVSAPDKQPQQTSSQDK